MNLTGRLIGASQDFKSGRMRLMFEVNEPGIVKERFDIEKDFELDIVTKKHCSKRSLNANAYFHSLSDKMADVTNISKARMKNYLLYEYGQKMFVDGEMVTLEVDDPNFWMGQEAIHTWIYKFNIDNTTTMVVLRPSHELNSTEFAKLLDGTISEAKELGIETMTPDEVARLTALWGAR